VGSSSVSDGLPELHEGPAAGSVSTITAFSITSNVVTYTAANSLAAGQWVEIGGLFGRFFMNPHHPQVLPTGLSSAQFEVTLPQELNNIASPSDSGTGDNVNVAVAFDASARYEESVENHRYHYQSIFNVGFTLDLA